MKRCALLATLALVLMGAQFALDDVQLDSFDTKNNESDVVITWKMGREDGVEKYVLKRSTPYTEGAFKEITTIDAHPGKPYRYRDSEIYKAASEEVIYNLWAVLQSGKQDKLAQESVNYKPTAVRRTWGSIKAMFQ